MKKLFVLACAALASLSITAQTVALNTEGREEAYVKTIIDRSTKNIAGLNIADKAKHEAVRNIVCNRYFELNDIYAERDEAMNKAKSLTGDAQKAAREAASDHCDSRLYRSHFAFSANLSNYLTEAEVTAIKDAMTYNKVKVTYDAYCDEILRLTAEEKLQIYNWLCEAREFAMDAESSNKKHDWFNKYKGRINNYLSKHGYDLRKEGEEWQKRIAARKKQ